MPFQAFPLSQPLAIRRFRAASPESPRVPAIALSTHVGEAARDHTRQAGFDAHPGKPIVADELIRVAVAPGAPRFDTID
jgi:CheY-like chemotaxis protein